MVSPSVQGWNLEITTAVPPWHNIYTMGIEVRPENEEGVINVILVLAQAQVLEKDARYFSRKNVCER